jgi:hypothetical protein
MTSEQLSAKDEPQCGLASLAAVGWAFASI